MGKRMNEAEAGWHVWLEPRAVGVAEGEARAVGLSQEMRGLQHHWL